MPIASAPRPHAVASAYVIRGTDPAREPTRRVYVSTTATGVPGMDFLAVERVVNGDLPLPTLNEAEQELAARLMTRAELTANEIAERLRVEPRTVTRWRAAWKRKGEGS
ncbi:helix-turn-helix domain-containing protein [Streptomyces sp. MUM 2J]|uniref:helix-turn-helix domain-containing protein n=1 Tax=Streptomyces sp. MUM 2J TaxID=2791987 RepID=UPI001F04F7EA|nr:helix-turn-helix domain-containing protein [Streptomyces sp. MUM 2J]MCH0562121.1 helix-turn-helix domain-containing protein [Streptomyces sp. MUM 2J]